MTQEEKDLLLHDLCARLPFGVMVNVIDHNDASYAHKGVLYSMENIDSDCNGTPCLFTVDGVGCAVDITEIKPYLRPMSSMTEEEKNELKVLNVLSSEKYPPYFQITDWYNEHHFDYRGLIEKGIALEAPKDMYV